MFGFLIPTLAQSPKENEILSIGEEAFAALFTGQA